MARIKLAVYLGREEHKLGAGKVRLLETIEKLGSISAAARSMGMAYRHAWELVDDLNNCFTKPVVAVSIGGREGGGARLTPWGRELIDHFHSMEKAANRAVGRHLRSIVASVAPAPRAAPRHVVTGTHKGARPHTSRRRS